MLGLSVDQLTCKLILVCTQYRDQVKAEMNMPTVVYTDLESTGLKESGRLRIILSSCQCKGPP